MHDPDPCPAQVLYSDFLAYVHRGQVRSVLFDDESQRVVFRVAPATPEESEDAEAPAPGARRALGLRGRRGGKEAEESAGDGEACCPSRPRLSGPACGAQVWDALEPCLSPHPSQAPRRPCP